RDRRAAPRPVVAGRAMVWGRRGVVRAGPGCPPAARGGGARGRRPVAVGSRWPGGVFSFELAFPRAAGAGGPPRRGGARAGSRAGAGGGVAGRAGEGGRAGAGAGWDGAVAGARAGSWNATFWSLSLVALISFSPRSAAALFGSSCKAFW